MACELQRDVGVGCGRRRPSSAGATGAFGRGAAGMSLRDFELAGAVTRQADIDATQAAIEKAGVEFIEGGVRPRKGAEIGARLT